MACESIRVMLRKAKRRRRRRRKLTSREEEEIYGDQIVTIKAPARDNAEVPILLILSGNPNGVRTREVVSQVKREWYKALSLDDFTAVYPKSGKRVVDTIIKFSRKHLVLKGQVYSVGVASKQGIWKATQLGLERAGRARDIWTPKYSEYRALLRSDRSESGGEDDEDTRWVAVQACSTALQGHGTERGYDRPG